MTDIAGPYSSITGKGSVIAAQMAVDEFGGKVLGRPIKVVSADHQNKADIGAGIARKWFDVEGVDAIFDVPNSAVALAVVGIAKERGRVVAFSGPSTAELTGKACSETTTQWAYDTYSLVNGSVKSLIKQGDKTWFFLALDATGGRAIETIGTRGIKEAGGQVLGTVYHPLNTPDFSAFLLQAQRSGAKAIALANAGADTVTAIKQAGEFALPESGTKIVGLIFLINDVHALGLQVARGAVLSEIYYWDLDDTTRAWNKRFMALHGSPANMLQASVYSSVLHYLKAVQKAGTDEGKAVGAAMRAMRVNDGLIKDAEIRADGRVMRDVFIFQVKTPAESKGPWDYYRVIGRVSASEAFRPIGESDCPLVKK
ncbi:MAG: ABC transporter substrate-binding protein [Hyphomonadaceae bacterium]|nr:ABC transporter substrate-binding protein [Hyphomonadaceae bacterium]